MNWKQITILFFLCLFAFSFYFQRETLIGYDTYYYMDQVCTGNYQFVAESPIFNLILPYLPCSFLYAKLLLFGTLFFSVLGIAYLGQGIVGKNGWIAGLLAFWSPELLWNFTKFENDAFGFVFLFWGLAFYFKNGLKNKIISLTLILIGTGIWAGGVYVIIALAFTSILFLATATPLVMLHFNQLYFSLMPNLAVAESYFGKGYKSLFILMLGFGGVRKKIAIPMLIFFAMSMINVKFAILAVPLLAVGLADVIIRMWEKDSQLWQLVASALVVGSLCMALFMGYTIVDSRPPTDAEWKGVSDAIKISEQTGKPIANSWELGYWFDFKKPNSSSARGGVTNQWFTPMDNPIFKLFLYEPMNCATGWIDKTYRYYDCSIPMKNVIVVSEHNVDCPIAKEFGRYKIYNC